MFVCEKRQNNPALSSELTQTSVIEPELTPKPFLKWAGGKRALAPLIAELMPESSGRFIEPFAGGASVAMHVSNKFSGIILNDKNEELMVTYEAIRDQLGSLMLALDGHANSHSQAYYYKIRSQRPQELSGVARAARLIYLNKTCFNGLYRVNRQGEFNVPLGNVRCPALYNKQNLQAVQRFLSRCKLSNDDYLTVLAREVRPGDVVYLDPPYAPISEYSDFKRYTKEQFREEDQRRLAAAYDWLVQLGAFPILSNSSCELTQSLYGKHLIRIVLAGRSINKNGDSRGAIPEILVLPRNSQWR